MAASTASRCFGLGHLDIRSTSLGLQLRLASSIELSSSIEDQPWQTLTESLQRKRLRLRDRPWLYSATNFRIVFGLRIADEIASLTTEGLIEALSRSLQDAEIWRQLCLSLTSVEASADGTAGLHTITVSLAPLSPRSKHERRCLHKLGADVPHHDVQPPDGVLAAPVEAVHLAMDITETASRKRKRSKIAHTEQHGSNINLESFQDLDFASECELSEDELLPLNHKSTFLEVADEDEGAGSGFDDALLDAFGLDGSNDEVDCQAHNLLACHNATSQSSLLLKRSSSALGVQPEDNDHPAVDSIMQLIDVGTRLAIAKNQTRLPKGMKVKASGNFNQLADVIPSLFSPSYLAAVSRRAVFLPTISHALSRTFCEDRVGRIEQRLTSRSADTHIASQTDISVLLWRMLQSGVHDSNAARRLKSLNNGGLAQGSEQPVDMLDSVQGSQDSGVSLTDGLVDDSDIDFDIDIDDDHAYLDAMVEDELLDSGLLDAENCHEDDISSGHFIDDETHALKRLLNDPTDCRNILELGSGSGTEDHHRRDRETHNHHPPTFSTSLEQSPASHDSLQTSDNQVWRPRERGAWFGLFPSTAEEDPQVEEMLAV